MLNVETFFMLNKRERAERGKFIDLLNVSKGKTEKHRFLTLNKSERNFHQKH
jgi:hypothetical protein